MKKNPFFIAFIILMNSLKILAAPLDDSTRVETLSQDKEFIELINNSVYFSLKVAETGTLELLQKYTAKTASKIEVKELTVRTGIKNIDSVFQHIMNLQKSLHQKFSFLKNKDDAKAIAYEAFKAAVKRDDVEKLKYRDADCLAN